MEAGGAALLEECVIPVLVEGIGALLPEEEEGDAADTAAVDAEADRDEAVLNVVLRDVEAIEARGFSSSKLSSSSKAAAFSGSRSDWL